MFGCENETSIGSDEAGKMLPSFGFIPRDKLNHNLIFEVQVVIKKVFDTNGEEVPRNKWVDHQIILNK